MSSAQLPSRQTPGKLQRPCLRRSLSHPNIVEFLGACTKPPKMFIIMELCARGSLFNLLHNTSTKLSYGQRVPLLVRFTQPAARARPRARPPLTLADGCGPGHGLSALAVAAHRAPRPEVAQPAH